MNRKPYPTDLSAEEWELIEPLLPPPNPIGSPRQVSLREILNAIFYVLDNGIKWRALPHDFPPWQTVYDYYRRWVRTGLWEKLNQTLAQKVREAEGRETQPSLILIDSQSVKTGEQGGDEKGVDGNKKVKGRKRHLAVDVLGLVYGVWVSAANVADVNAAPIIVIPVLENYPRVEKILADQGYRGKRPQQIEQGYDINFELTKKLGEGFQVEPKRWIVERTFAWLENARRLCRDYERLPENHEGFIYVAMIRLMLRSLTNNQRSWLSS